MNEYSQIGFKKRRLRIKKKMIKKKQHLGIKYKGNFYALTEKQLQKLIQNKVNIPDKRYNLGPGRGRRGGYQRVGRISTATNEKIKNLEKQIQLLLSKQPQQQDKEKVEKLVKEQMELLKKGPEQLQIKQEEQQSAKNDNTEKITEFRNLDKKLREKTQETEEKDQQIITLQQQIQNEQENPKHQRQLEKLQKQKQSLERQVENLQLEQEQLKEDEVLQYNILVKKHDKQLRQKQELKEKLQENEEQLQQYEQKLQQNEQLLEQGNQTLKQFEENEKQYLKQIDKYKQKLQKGENQVQEQEKQLQKNEDQLQQSKMIQQQLEQQIQNQYNQNKELQQIFQQQEQQLEKQTTKIKTFEKLNQQIDLSKNPLSSEQLKQITEDPIQQLKIVAILQEIIKNFDGLKRIKIQKLRQILPNVDQVLNRPLDRRQNADELMEGQDKDIIDFLNFRKKEITKTKPVSFIEFKQFIQNKNIDQMYDQLFTIPERQQEERQYQQQQQQEYIQGIQNIEPQQQQQQQTQIQRKKRYIQGEILKKSDVDEMMKEQIKLQELEYQEDPSMYQQNIEQQAEQIQYVQQNQEQIIQGYQEQINEIQQQIDGLKEQEQTEEVLQQLKDLREKRKELRQNMRYIQEGYNKRNREDLDSDDSDMEDEFLNTLQIQDYMNNIMNEVQNENVQFLGVFGMNQEELFKKIKVSDPQEDKYYCFIMNTEPINQDGQHWFAVYFNNNEIGIFDSSGEISKQQDDLIKKIVKELDTDFLMKYKKNSNKIQNDDNNWCGFYSILFLIRCINSNFNYEYSSMKNENQKQSEKQLQQIFSEL